MIISNLKAAVRRGYEAYKRLAKKLSLRGR